jgi:hypothetical protein
VSVCAGQQLGAILEDTVAVLGIFRGGVVLTAIATWLPQ